MTRQEALIKKAEYLQKHSDDFVLCRVGHYYEAYDMDAIELNRVCNLFVVQRADTGQVAGFPHHSLDIYLPKLVRGGNRVVIFE